MARHLGVANRSFVSGLTVDLTRVEYLKALIAGCYRCGTGTSVQRPRKPPVAPSHQRPRAVVALECGTTSGYQTHKRRGSEPCDECRKAQRDYMREYRRSKGQSSRVLIDVGLLERAATHCPPELASELRSCLTGAPADRTQLTEQSA